ncbi:hypothetical protein, partial [Halopiger djelfimassiliensis]|uniref:hypothetical protein n=1 Tax=Halopiger djelfimassiliensis TaxID=1293047 RepID=UPI001E2D4612
SGIPLNVCRSREKTHNGIETDVRIFEIFACSAIAAGRKPTTGLKLVVFTRSSSSVTSVAAGRKPTTGLKLLQILDIGRCRWGRSGEKTHNGSETIAVGPPSRRYQQL